MDELEDINAPSVKLQTTLKNLDRMETELDKLQRGAALIGEVQEAAKRSDEAAQHMQGAARQTIEAAQSMQEALTPVLESLKALAVGVEDCVGTIEKVYFPSRLDEIHATVSGIHTTVQQVSLCIEALEKNVKDIIDTRYRESQSFLSQRLADAVSRLQDIFTQKIDTAHGAITEHLGAQIQATQQQTIDKITEIQTQFNKTDATVSGIHTTMQQVSLRIESLERNVRDTIDVRQQESQSFLSQHLADTTSRLNDVFQQQLDRAQHALTGHLETQLGTTQREIAHRFAELQRQLIRDMTKNRYLIFAALSIGLITIGILVFMR
jgi:archaellum component FlaC